MGATIGLIVNSLFPGQSLPLILNACVTRTLISTIILACQFIPIMFANLTGFFLTPKTPLINAQLGIEE